MGAAEERTSERGRLDASDVLRELLDRAPTPIFARDRQSRFLLANRAYGRLIQIDSRWLIGKKIEEVFPPEIAGALKREDHCVFDSGEAGVGEERVSLPDGTHTFLSMKFPLRRLEGEICAVGGIAADITETKRLKRDAALLAALVENTQDAIISVDSSLNIMSWNDGAVKVFGYSSSEVLGKSFLALVPESLQAEVRAVFERVGKGNAITPYDTTRLHKDGTFLDISATLSPIRDPSGTLLGVSWIGRNIGEKKQTEKKLQNLAQSLADANEDLKLFAFAASHDIQEPLRTIRAYLKLIQSRSGSGLNEDSREFLTFAINAAERLQVLTKSLLDYSRAIQTPLHSTSFSLEELVRRVVRSVEITLRDAGARAQWSGLPAIVGDQAQLAQVLQNLICNAIVYRSERTPEIRIAAHEDDDKWVISVSDNGIGIASDQLEAIFEPFRRLHARAERPGTGIGLSISRRIVERHGGRLWAESQPGMGSTFYFTLPKPVEEKGMSSR